MKVADDARSGDSTAAREGVELVRKRKRGRPQAASHELVEEAALELFFEQGYDGTSVDHIAERAGIARKTFFNYFGAKADVLWFGVDAVLTRMERGEEPVGVDRFIELLGSDEPPLPLAFAEVLECEQALRESRSERLDRLSALEASLHGGIVAATANGRFGSGASDAEIRADLYGQARAAVALAAVQHWASAGRERLSLDHYVALVRITDGSIQQPV